MHTANRQTSSINILVARVVLARGAETVQGLNQRGSTRCTQRNTLITHTGAKTSVRNTCRNTIRNTARILRSERNYGEQITHKGKQRLSSVVAQPFLFTEYSQLATKSCANFTHPPALGVGKPKTQPLTTSCPCRAMVVTQSATCKHCANIATRRRATSSWLNGNSTEIHRWHKQNKRGDK